MSEPNYLLVGFICLVIVICYVLGFFMGRVFEESKQKDKEQAEADKKANKKIAGRVRR
tara:strand:+ start:360 stop:533 length:174 start_codon:yes stop_codon:yes gene_type:complete